MIKCGTNHCALVTDQGRIYTWGSGERGATSSPSQADEYEPVEARIHKPANAAPTFFKYIDCGPNFTVAVSKHGQVFCTGDNSKLQLGIHGLEYVPVFTMMEDFNPSIKKVACGTQHTLFLSE